MEKKKNGRMGPVLIVTAAVFWGSMGIFVRKLGGFGFDPIQIVTIRITIAALVFSAIAFIKDPSSVRISDIPLFLGLGIGSILFFTVCYFTAITMMPLSVAAILLYTSPVWIMLMSALFFHEKISTGKTVALILAFAGCVLVSGISGDGLTVKGILLGLGSGIGYGLYSILGTVALKKYSPYTVTAYTFIIAAAGSLFICRPKDMLFIFSSSENKAGLVMLCVITAVATAVIPFLTYTLGLRMMEAGRAGILATVEPLVATLIGVFVFREPLSLTSSIGIILILAAVVILNIV